MQLLSCPDPVWLPPLCPPHEHLGSGVDICCIWSCRTAAAVHRRLLWGSREGAKLSLPVGWHRSWVGWGSSCPVIAQCPLPHSAVSPHCSMSPLCPRRTRTPTRVTRAAPLTQGRTMSPSRPTTSSSPATPPGSTTTGERGWARLLLI